MTYNEYENEFRKKAMNAGFSEEKIQICLNYAKVLIDNKLPVIYNTSNLAALVGYQRLYLKRAALFTPFFYRNFEIKKKNGKKRKISEPLPSLKEIQDWILRNILYEIPVSRFSKAYIPKRNIIDNVKFHKGSPKVLTIDIIDFFPSIKRERIEVLFKSFGYSSLISNLLSKLCCLDDWLPQGAPTSPYLTNIILHEFDNKVENYCKINKIRYTRYADDLTFSGDFNDELLIHFVREKLAVENLKINENKTKVMINSQRQIVTGIVVNNKIQLPKEERKELRQAIYYIDKYGLDDHLSKIQCKRKNYLQHLLGIANYMIFINPLDQEILKYKEKLTLMIKQKVIT